MRSSSAVLSATFLALALLTGCTAAGDDGNHEQATPPTTAPDLDATPSAAPPPIPSAPELPGAGWDLLFLDDRDAVAVASPDCAEGDDPERPCQDRVAVLADGAWEQRRGPRLPAAALTAEREYRAAGDGVVRLSVLDAAEPRDWISTDGAVTWRETDGTPSGEITSVPDGAAVWPRRGDGPARLVVLLPGTGELRTLAAQPPLELLRDVQLLPDGGYWAAGTDGTDTPRVAVSRDHGESWELLPSPPAEGGEAPAHLLLQAGRDGLYLFGADSASALTTVHWSGDGGATWERRWSAGAAEPTGALLGTPIAAADGRLIVYATDGVRVSADGGRTFTVDRPGRPPERPRMTPAGYLLTDVDHPGHYRLSADGFTWRTVILGSEEG